MLFAVIKSAALIIVAAGKMRRLHKRPRQILVAAFTVVLALLLVVALADAFYAARVTGKVPRIGKTFGVAGLQGNGQAQNFANPRHFLEALGDLIAANFGGTRGTVTNDPGDGLGYTCAFHVNENVPDDGGIFKAYDTDVTWKHGREK